MNEIPALIARLHAAGITFRANGPRLGYRPREKITPALLAMVRRQKWAILAQLAAGDDAVRWRVAAMRERYPEAGEHPVPFLTARDFTTGAQSCLSCGEPRHLTATSLDVRCLPCAHAALLTVTRGDMTS